MYISLEFTLQYFPQKGNITFMIKTHGDNGETDCMDLELDTQTEL